MNLTKIPKLKKITKKFYKLSALKHPDKNGGSKAATAEFQTILSAYHTAGAAASDTATNNDDTEVWYIVWIFFQDLKHLVLIFVLSITV